jgi:hypothetical protein
MFLESSLSSPGGDELRWLAPVRPNDTLHLEVLEVRPSNSKPDRGIARLRYQTKNQRKEAIPSFIVNHLPCRQKAQICAAGFSIACRFRGTDACVPPSRRER